MFDNLLKLNGSKSEYLSDLQNPFKKDKITQITIFIRPFDLFGNKKKYMFKASIDFQSNNTKGEHEFEEKTFEALMQKLDQFINNL